MSDERHNQAIQVARWLDISAADFPEHEFETYRLLREHLPIARTEIGSPLRQSVSGAWFFSKYEDVAFALRNPKIFSSQTMGGAIRPWIPQAVDPPEHTEYRKILNPWFSQAEMGKLEPHIRNFAIELLEPMLAKDEIDFVSEFAEPFPTIIFCELMGFPLDDHSRLMRWKDIMIHAGTETVAADLGLIGEGETRPFAEVSLAARSKAARELYAYFAGLLEQRRREPRDDMLTRLLGARYAGQRLLTQEELEDILLLLLMAGLDTVTSSLSLIMVYFAEDPRKRHEFIDLMDDEARTGPAIEELMRMLSTVTPGRRVARTTRYKGVELLEGDVVMLSTPSANRDPDTFPEPDEVIFDRHPNPHVGLAVGPHRCLGMHLARRELRIALQEIHRRMPDYQIAPGHTPSIYGGGVKGVRQLRLVKGQTG